MRSFNKSLQKFMHPQQMPNNYSNRTRFAAWLNSRHKALALMRYAIAVATAIFTGCQPSHEEVLAKAEKTQAAVIQQAEAKQTLHAFGGTIIGKDEGEWGGEVSFREPDGSAYTVISDNSHGVFEMHYGVIALTGLAHLGTNRGTVHLLSRPHGSRVSATPLMQLPGSPCDVVRVDNRVTMRIHSGYKKLDNGIMASVYSCYALVSGKELVKYQCPLPEPEICFG